jgi:hypothetical protein
VVRPRLGALAMGGRSGPASGWRLGGRRAEMGTHTVVKFEHRPGRGNVDLELCGAGGQVLARVDVVLLRGARFGRGGDGARDGHVVVVSGGCGWSVVRRAAGRDRVCAKGSGPPWSRGQLLAMNTSASAR